MIKTQYTFYLNKRDYSISEIFSANRNKKIKIKVKVQEENKAKLPNGSQKANLRFAN